MTTKPITKKVINSPETCVDDNLRGLVITFPSLRLHAKHRVVTMKCQEESCRVAIIGGGGSGHEPFAAGLVGPGMLDGAVSGGIFASPPTGNVLYAIEYLNKTYSGGVLVIIGNYTGDRLNFGKAIEKAKILGIQAESIIVGEDIASSKNKTGGRGMIAEVLLYKLCAAMSSKGWDLQKILQAARDAADKMATLGVCLTACSLPGQPPLFEISPEEIEIGAGVHGEAGVGKIRMSTAKEIVGIMMDQLIAHMELKAGARLIAAVNNLGGTSLLEINIINAEIKNYLESKHIILERIFAGHLKSSLEMAGFQICLFQLTPSDGDSWLEMLDSPTSCRGWPGTDMSRWSGDNGSDDEEQGRNESSKITTGPILTPPEQDLMRLCLKSAAEQLMSNERLLNRLDSGCGDGDCGITMKRFGLALKNYLNSASLKNPAQILWELSEIAEKDIGGTSGGIYSLGLSAASQAMAKSTENNTDSWLMALENSIETISKYGGAEPGDRTMLDTLHEAASAIKQNLKAKLSVLAERTALAAEQGAKNTANMTARAGRASYVSSGYTHDEDAGARAASLWLTAILHKIADRC